MLRKLAKRILKLFVRPERVDAPIPPDTAAGTAEPVREAVAAAAAPRAVVSWRTRLASAVVAAGVAIFGLIGFLVGSGRTAEPDLALTLGVQQSGNPLLVATMVLVSLFGFPPLNIILVLAAVAFFWLAGYRTESLYAGLAGVGVGVVGMALKQLWLRPRPAGEDVVVLGSVSGHSFPSGHTLFYVAFFGFLFYWVYAFLKKGRLRTILLGLLGALIVLVGPSRIYLGHHWASDVLAAYTLGLACLLVLIRAYGASLGRAPIAARRGT